MDTTSDGLLNRRIKLEQPKDGFRVAVDTVLLAAAVPAQGNARVIDFGCGAGGAMLCLASRVPGARIMGIEIQEDLVELCRKNIAANNFGTNVEVGHGDATDLPDMLQGSFDHAMMNPPYHDAASHDASPNATKRTANTEKEGDLPLWIASAALALKDGGSLTIIHRADREKDILKALQGEFGRVEILPIVTKPGEPPKRVIMRAVKTGAARAVHCRPFVLHTENGAYTEAAENSLRHAGALEFTT